MFRVIADAERRGRRVLFFEHKEVRMGLWTTAPP
jgi:hypothetical protein